MIRAYLEQRIAELREEFERMAAPYRSAVAELEKVLAQLPPEAQPPASTEETSQEVQPFASTEESSDVDQ